MTREGIQSMSVTLDPTLLAELRRLELRTTRRIDATLSGKYRSAFKGTGLIFSDIREYQPGDDVKHLHWKVTARTGVPHCKSFEEDRQLSVMALVDCSASMRTGLEKSRYHRSVELAALLTMLARQNGDAMGVALCAEEVETYFAPKRKRRHYQMILAELLGHRTPTGGTALGPCMEFVSRSLKSRSVIFVCSDFHDKDYYKSLRMLSCKHDVIGVYFDPIHEETLPDVGLLQVRDPESGRTKVIDSASSAVRSQLRQAHEAHRRSVQREWRKRGAEVLFVRDNPLRELSQFMDTRVSHFR